MNQRIGSTMTYSYQKKLTARKAMMRRRRIFFSILLLIAAAAVFVIVITSAVKPGSTVFYDHIFIDGIDLSGMSMQDAHAALTAQCDAKMQRMTLSFDYEEQSWPDVTPKDLGATFDIQEQLERAYAIGREGNWLKRRAEILALGETPYYANTRITYDEEELRSRLAQVKDQIDYEPINASVEFRPDKEERFIFSHEQTGRVVDLDSLFDQAKGFLDTETGGAVRINAEVIEPDIYAADLEANTALITKVTTSVKGSPKARIHNIEMGLNAFNGMTLQPGEEFSFNDIVGPRTEEAGYQLAAVILRGSYVDGPGGGVCQASTTLYHAVVLADLEIVERNKHSIPSSYVPVGQDATVDYDGDVDFRFRNNTDYPIYIRAVIAGDNCEITIYGRPLPESMKIELVTEELDKVPAPDPIIQVDVDGTKVPAGKEYYDDPKSRPGYTTRTYRVYYEDGVEVDREELSHDRYRESVGTRWVPAGTIITPPNTDPFATNGG